MRLRPFALAFLALVLVPALALALTSQRDQIGIDIIINVTPNPLGYSGGATVAAAQPRITSVRFREMKAPLSHPFQAQSLQFLQGSAPMSGVTIAQAAPQKAVEVEASVSPNPNATLLVSNVPAVNLNAEAGVKTVFTCAYQVSVDTTSTSWQLKDGLATDFSSGTATFLGGDVSKNTYVSTPNPTSTPFSVYADNGGAWNVVNGVSYSGAKTFCVDLTLNIPITTTQGTYSSNAIYTLFF